MIHYKKSLIRFLLLIVMFFTFIQLVEATVTNFTVYGGEEVTKSLNLAIDDHVLIRFTIVGQSDHTLYFFMTYPNGTVWDFGKTGDAYYSFVCNLEGEYVLHFSNVGSSEDKLVTLDYEVEHYIFGMPQMFFLTIIIVLVCIAAVAAFVLMGKQH
ncbi:hypothetical protein HXY32_02130 [Candidatus Bathyarchaeota archaeon]|nr:hypothetical protein [Candidatus Bathyarchaeota archaeon]